MKRGGKITILYNAYVKHSVLPEDFLKREKTPQQLLRVFTQHEIEQENKAMKNK